MSRTQPPSSPFPQWLADVRFSTWELHSYEQACKALHVEIHHWIRQVLNQAAKDVLGPTAISRIRGDDPTGP